VSKFLEGFPTDDGRVEPEVDIVSMYMDQVSERDMGRTMATAHGVTIYPSIPKALCQGGSDLDVDGIFLIGEHGDYAWNEKEQHLYPRKFFFEQICGTIAAAGKPIPVFSDKHLSYNWPDAKWMYDRARELGIPFMAGSSVPLAWRSPYLEYELETDIDAAVSVAYGPTDSYGFHTLELLQCMIERRKGGETGIASVQCFEGADVWKASSKGLFDRELADRAIRKISNREKGPLEDHCENPILFLMTYRDGLKTASLLVNGYARGWAFAARRGGEIDEMEVTLPGDPHAHFSYLGLNIHSMFLTGEPRYPAERTLLVTGALEALLDSRYQGSRELETPHLDIVYESYTASPIRPTGERPSGASLGEG
tara:strand:- start:1441 stop:2541 length:1101 start_codon:yes stop_codon:yes gene_type:complete